jgi:hypothetical protein
MRIYIARFRLRNGTAGTLDVLARHSCDALIALIDHFGDELRSCSARPAQ